MSGLAWLAVAFGGLAMSLLVTGLLTRVHAQDEELAAILDLPWGEHDVDPAVVSERRPVMVENTIGLATRVVDQFDPKGSVLAKVELARVPIRPGELVLVVAAGAVVLGGFLAGITSTPGLGVVGFAVSPFLAKALLDRRITKRRARFEEQFPEALTLIASSLTAGHTFLRSIQLMTEEAGGPLAEEFGRVVSETQLGDPLIDALDRMASRLRIRDVDWVVQAIRIQQTVGGKLADLLHTLADFIRARDEIRREVDVLTAEGRLSAYVLGGLPVLLALAISVMNPDYMEPMYRGWGFVWLGGAAALTVASIGIILRMVKSVEV